VQNNNIKLLASAARQPCKTAVGKKASARMLT